MHHRHSARSTLRHLLCATLVSASVVTSLPGCVSPPHDPAPHDPAPPGVSSLSAVYSPAPGCTGRRWVGVLPSASLTCPAPSASADWTVSRVFPTSAPNELARYCLYTWNHSADPDASDIGALHSSTSPVNGLSEDCVVVGPLTGEEEEVNALLRPMLADALFRAAGGLEQLPAVKRGVELGRVRIAVADTSPWSDGAEIPLGNSHHGYSVGWIAQNLACPDGPDASSCRAHVTTHLALPRLTNRKIDLVNGGYFGTPVELARAIHEPVEAWKKQATNRPNAQPQQRLVINLSLGWQPTDDGCPERTTASLPLTPKAGEVDDDTVFGALLHAACHGALVIAAAGNDPGGISSRLHPGPTCPAAWQRVLAPTKAQCEALEGPSYDIGLPSGLPLLPPKNIAAVDRPLIYGIGGVDYTGAPLSTTRRQSLGRHAAIGFQGVAGDPTTPGLPAPLTGSSISAAVVSGAAAALWAYRPELTGHQIMALLHKTGSPVKGYTSVLADLGLELDNPHLAGPLHQVSLCHALAALCSDPASGCTPPKCAEPVASPFQNPTLGPSLSQAINDLYGGETGSPADETFKPPANRLYQSYLTPPWTEPSPIQPVCGGSCVFNVAQQRLMVSINPSNSQVTSSLTNMTLVLENQTGETHVFAAANVGMEMGMGMEMGFGLNPGMGMEMGMGMETQLGIGMDIGMGMETQLGIGMGLENQQTLPSNDLEPGDQIVLEPIPLPEGFYPTRATLVFEIDNNNEPASVVEPILVDAGQ